LAHDQPDVVDEIVQVFRDAVASLSEPRLRAERVARQRTNVLSVVGDFDGAHAVADSFMRLLAEGAVPGR